MAQLVFAEGMVRDRIDADRAQRLRALEANGAQLEKLMAESGLDLPVLREANSGDSRAGAAAPGPIGDPAGRTWPANVRKCGDETPHLRWDTRAPTESASFHVPQGFGPPFLEACPRRTGASQSQR